MPVLDEILAESTSTNPNWLESIPHGNANHVPCAGNDFVANATQRQLIQQMGEAYGCHTCNRRIADTPQNFIVDHIPPRGFFENPTQSSISYRFYPHCDKCAAVQAALVSSASTALIQKMNQWAGNPLTRGAMRTWLAENGCSAKQIDLLTGGAGNSITGHGGLPTSTDRTNINRLPGTIVCHTCQSPQASHIYHADHNPPVEFAMTNWFPTLINTLATTVPAAAQIQAALGNRFFRPQCPYCSHRQGGRCQGLVVQAVELIQGLQTTTRSGRQVNQQRYKV